MSVHAIHAERSSGVSFSAPRRPPGKGASSIAADDPRTRWNARWAAEVEPSPPGRFLVERAHLLPTTGRALDLAGGTGRHAIWLAQRGLTTTLVDVSDEACRVASLHARAAGVDVSAIRRDLTTDGPPAGPWDVVVSLYFLDRDVWAQAAAALAPGGLLLVCQPTVRNLERHDRPPREWLLEQGEAARLATGWPGSEVVECGEGWTADGRHEAHVVVRNQA